MKLIALDLDGTTLNSSKEINQENVKMIKRAQASGNIVVILSGRSKDSIEKELAKVDINCPIGANNGTSIYVENKLIKQISLPRRQNKKIISLLDQENLPYKVTTNKGSFAPANWSKRFNDFIESAKVPKSHFENEHFSALTQSPEKLGQKVFENPDEILTDKEIMVQKYFVIALNPEQKEKIQNDLKKITGLKVLSSTPFSFDVSNINGHKGTALKVFAEHFNIPLDQTIAVGDEGNDIPMLEAAGLGVAVENADNELKKFSDFITLSNDENGVAHVIAKYVLNRS
jgi:hypothetical protein